MGNLIGVDPDRVFGLQKDYGEKAHIAMKKNDEQFFDAFEALLKANYQQKVELIEKVLGKKSEPQKTFVVGQVFQHRNESLTPQYFGANFNSWVWAQAQARTVEINAFGKSTLKDYVLPKTMNDTAIQNAANSAPIEEDTFWRLAYLLVIDPKLGKKILKYELHKDKVYVFHARLTSGKVVALLVRWDVDEWRFSARGFDRGSGWDEGVVFLYPVIA